MKKGLLYIALFSLLMTAVFLFSPLQTKAATSCPTGEVWSDTYNKCVPIETTCKDNNQFKSYIKPGNCLDSYDAWLIEVWGWAMRIMVPLSVLIFSIAGVLYMTSEGDSNRVGVAKKMIIGVLSGLGLLILGRVLLVIIIGDASVGGWLF